MSWGRQGVLMGLTAIVDLLRTLTAIVDWESRVALTPVPLGARLADLDSHESQASLLSHSLLGDQIQKVNCATECEDMPITSSTSSSKLCGWAPVLFCELDGQRSSPRQGAHRLLGLLAMIKSRASTHSCFSVFGFLAMIKSRASTHSCSRLAGLGHRRRLAELGPDGCRELSSASGPPRQATAAQRRAADAHVLHARHRRSAGAPQRCRQEVPPPPAPSRPLGYDQVAGFDAFLLIAMLHSCVRWPRTVLAFRGIRNL